MTQALTSERHGAVQVLSLDNPPVNALGAALREALLEGIARAALDREVEALVLVGRGRCFSAGADIREFGRPPRPGAPQLREVIDAAEDCAKPVVAAIHGTAVGGGLELALGCHYRIGDRGARLGLPEIKLGLIPGAGGTQRLPRLVGVAPALDMILGGDFLPAVEARGLGLLDRLAEGDLLEDALAFAKELAAEGGAPRKTRELEVAAARDADLFEATRARIEGRARGLIAPFRCIESVRNAVTLPFDEAMAKERAFFLECRNSDQSKGQRHLFFAERQAAKVPGLPADTAARPIGSAAVVGCGTMGGGIAMSFANAGIPVQVLEASQEALDKGLGVIAKNYGRSLSRGRISRQEMDARRALIRGTTDYPEIAQADIVIEAVFEEMDLKKTVFAALGEVCKPETILATNTSTLDLDEIAAATARADRVMGTHFFSPANVMRLMENVRGAKTSAQTIATVMGLSKALGKAGVLVGVCDGFVGNRMLYAYTQQANFLLEEGALPQQVDKVIHDFGFPMGPFAMGDLAGLDVGWRVRRHRAKTRPEAERPLPIADRICELGRFGQKTGAGWYRYAEGGRTPVPDPEIEALIVGVSEELGIARREIDDREILDRCLYPLINEGAKLLEEGIAARASDIDVIWVHGYGFPAYRGGPMFHADRIGAAAVHDAMCRLWEAQGDLLKPAALFADLARSGKRFADL